MSIETQVSCPYCGESITIFVDGSVDDQTYTEDCSVCCRPMVLHVLSSDMELISVELSRESD